MPIIISTPRNFKWEPYLNDTDGPGKRKPPNRQQRPAHSTTKTAPFGESKKGEKRTRGQCNLPNRNFNDGQFKTVAVNVALLNCQCYCCSRCGRERQQLICLKYFYVEVTGLIIVIRTEQYKHCPRWPRQVRGASTSKKNSFLIDNS